jgi:lipoprotein-anchoring transpeptidase ErfK/SrfK
MFRRVLGTLVGLGLLFMIASPLAAVAAPPSPGGTYVVQRGDTLAEIAARLGVSQSALARANGIADVNHIYPGERLVVPGSKSTAPGGSVATQASATDQAVTPDRLLSPADSGQGQDGIYVVRRGDTLSAIAHRLGISLQGLLAANHLANADFVFVGQRLVIPGQAAELQSQPQPPKPDLAAHPSQAPRPDPGANSSATPAVASASPSQGAENNAGPDTVAAGVAGSDTAAAGVAGPDAGVAGVAGPDTTAAGVAGPDAGVAGVAGSGAAISAASDGPHPTPEGADPNAVQGGAAASADRSAKADRWIDVNLSAQTLTAYEGKRPVFTTRVSTGLQRTPTVTGNHKIYVKIPSQTMTGPGYRLPGVPYVMFFYKGYGIHGTYWHNNFGHPMSHGCVNVSTPDAAWLYGWASIGTRVVTHY